MEDTGGCDQNSTEFVERQTLSVEPAELCHESILVTPRFSDRGKRNCERWSLPVDVNRTHTRLSINLESTLEEGGE